MVGDLINAGQLTSSSNSNAIILGERNTGLIENNSNLKLEVFDSVLNLLSNSNALINILSSKLEAKDTSNAKINGKDNNLAFKNDSNIKFSGDSNTCKLQSNSNFKLSGDNNLVELLSNSNTNIQGSNGEVKAAENSNLKVSGDGNKVSIRGTSNHSLQRVQDANLVRIIPQNNKAVNFGSSLISSFFSSGKNERTWSHPQYQIDYMAEAVIDKEDYDIGIFKFKLQEEEARVKMELNPADYDAGTLKILPSEPDALNFSAEKNGVEQVLKVLGPGIKCQTINGKSTILVNLIAAAGI